MALKEVKFDHEAVAIAHRAWSAAANSGDQRRVTYPSDEAKRQARVVALKEAFERAANIKKAIERSQRKLTDVYVIETETDRGRVFYNRAGNEVIPAGLRTHVARSGKLFALEAHT